MSRSYKQPYHDAVKAGKQKDEQISELEKQLSDIRGKFDAQAATDKETVSRVETEKTVLEEQIKALEEKNGTLEERNESLGDQLQEKELGRFASAYSKQEKEYRAQQDLWFRLSVGATAFLAISILFSIFGSSLIQKSWHEEPGFYLLNALFLTLFIYALKQHSHLGNLIVDYANRKTLAQSYQYIVADKEEHADIKLKFLENAAGIFTAEASTRSNDITVAEAIAAKILGKSE